jgi:hypothetical protein
VKAAAPFSVTVVPEVLTEVTVPIVVCGLEMTVGSAVPAKFAVEVNDLLVPPAVLARATEISTVSPALNETGPAIVHAELLPLEIVQVPALSPFFSNVTVCVPVTEPLGETTTLLMFCPNGKVSLQLPRVVVSQVVLAIEK